MSGSGITRRFIVSILLVVFLSLALLGVFLLHFFRAETMNEAQTSLLLNARIIERTLERKLLEKDPELSEIAALISEETKLRITILDANGKVLADTSEPAERLDNHFARTEVQQALTSAQNCGSAVRYSQTLRQNLMYAAIAVRHGDTLIGVIRTATSLAPVEAAYDHIVYSILIALLIALLAGGALAIWLARRQLRPILSISEDARRIAAGDLRHRIQLHTGDEFDILSETINRLTRRLSKRIRESEAEAAKLSLILSQMDNAVMLIDDAGRILSTNPQARAIFLWEDDPAPHHSIHLLGNAELSETARKVLRDGTPKTMTLRHGKRTFEIYLAAFRDKEESAVLAVFHDISVLQELTERQAAFTSNAAHELATPLTAIAGFAELLREDDFSDPESAHHYADVICKESERMTRLIQDLLALAHLDDQSFREQLPRTNVDGSAALEEIRNELLKKAREKKQRLFVTTSDAAARISGTPGLIRQMLRNLIENAIKYTPEGGTIEAVCEADEAHVMFTVRDTGIGIAQEDLPRIFDRFYRVDKARARKSGGNGIGLSLVKFITELFGGTIEVESRLGAGTRFKVIFPRIAE